MPLKKTVDINEGKQNIDLDFIARQLKTLMLKSNISTKLLSDTTGISISAINNLKRGEGNPTIGTLCSLANFFNIAVGEFLGIESNVETLKQVIPLNVYDLRHANNRKSHFILNSIMIEKPKNANFNNSFGVVINNNSLQPLYEKGTIFIVSLHQPVIDGDIVVVSIHNNTNSIKRCFLKNNSIFLKNITLSGEVDKYQRNEVKILGMVLQIIQNIG